MPRRIDIDGDDSRMRVRRADDEAVQRIRRREIGNVAAVSLHEAQIFKAVDAAAQQGFGHASCIEQEEGKSQPRVVAHALTESASARIRRRMQMPEVRAPVQDNGERHG